MEDTAEENNESIDDQPSTSTATDPNQTRLILFKKKTNQLIILEKLKKKKETMKCSVYFKQLMKYWRTRQNR